MAEVRIDIVGRSYTLACRDGEEAHLLKLGQIVDAKARDAARAMGSLTENRQLLMAALLLADMLGEQKQASGGADTDAAADAIERLSARIEKLASALEGGATNT